MLANGLINYGSNNHVYIKDTRNTKVIVVLYDDDMLIIIRHTYINTYKYSLKRTFEKSLSC